MSHNINFTSVLFTEQEYVKTHYSCEFLKIWPNSSPVIFIRMIITQKRCAWNFWQYLIPNNSGFGIPGYPFRHTKSVMLWLDMSRGWAMKTHGCSRGHRIYIFKSIRRYLHHWFCRRKCFRYSRFTCQFARPRTLIAHTSNRPRNDVQGRTLERIFPPCINIR